MSVEVNDDTIEEREDDAEMGQLSLDECAREEIEHNKIRKSIRTSSKPTWLRHFVTPTSNVVVSANAVATRLVSSNFNYFFVTIVSQTDPTSFHQAIKISH